MTDNWNAVMADATALAEANGLEFYELRNAFSEQCIVEDDEFYRDHGVTSSDMNHMLYGGMLARRDEVERLAKRLGRENAQRNAIVNEIAEATDQHPTLVLQQLRELFAPLDTDNYDPVTMDSAQYLADNPDVARELLDKEVPS